MTITSLDTDGGKLAIEFDGSPDAPLVICFPGLGDTRDAYDAVSTRLVASGFRVARVDLRGHGDSSARFARYGDDAVADDFLSVARHLGAGRPVVLAGNSLAAGAATIAAGREPSLVAGVVLLGPFLRGGGGALATLMSAMFWRPWGPALWRVYAATLWPGLGAEGAKARAAASARMLSQKGRWPAFQKSFAGCAHDNFVGPWLGKVGAVPALVVMGDKDPDFADQAGEARWVASHFDHADVVMVPEVGHAPHHEKPDVVGTAMVGFLEKIRFGQQ